MAAREKGGRVVFIGNIPYGVSEEQICEIFGRVGQVVNFRLVYDKESGKPKGFGFLEYTNVDEAASAVRNLNEFEVMGRTLRVDYSNDNGGGKKNDGGGGGGGGGGNYDGGSGRAPPPAHFNLNGGDSNGVSAPPADPAALPPLPPGADLDPMLSAPEQISRTLASIPPPQLLDIISQMKNLVATEPQRATALLTSAPQLSYAVFQALLLLGLVEPNVIQSLIQQTGPGPQQQQQPPPQQAPPLQQQQQQQMYQQQPPSQFPPQHNMQQPPPFPPQVPHGYPPGYAPTPPVQQQQYQPPPQQYQPPPQQQQPPPQAQPSQQDAIRAIMELTREQIFAMEPGARDQILGLRAQFGAPV